MIENFKKFLFTAALVLPLFLTCVNAETIPSDRQALRGINRIGVQVGEISPLAKEKGINRKYLRENIESKLRSDGIYVVSHDELEKNSEIAYLLITVLLSYNEPIYSYVLMLSLNEKVHMVRDPKIISNAIPWWRIMKGEHLGNLGLLQEVDKTLIQLINEFSRDYVAVNPAAISIQPGKR
jgi:hypothetical protein